jgi:hypothetical protein
MVQRKDKQCHARVIAVNEQGVLIEATWGKDNRNTLFVSEEYFKRKYGRDATTLV